MNNQHNLIIIDWDDTLFPTSWVIKNNIDLTSSTVRNKYIVFFSKLDLLLYKLFLKILKHGTMFIVTNATLKWIIISSNILPSTQQLIRKKIPIISSRDSYQNVYPENKILWKKFSFEELADNYKNNNIQNILSIGDAEYEFLALVNLYVYKNNKKILKSIKFLSSPSYETLIDQIEVLNNVITDVIKQKKHFDLVFREME